MLLSCRCLEQPCRGVCVSTGMLLTVASFRNAAHFCYLTGKREGQMKAGECLCPGWPNHLQYILQAVVPVII